MDIEEWTAITEGGHVWTSIQKQLFQQDTTEAMEDDMTENTKDMPQNLTTHANDFHEQARGQAKAQSVPSFKDKLVSGTKTDGCAHNPQQEEILIEPGDVAVNMEGVVPTITFSKRVKEIMEGCMRYTAVIKILGRFVRQDALRSKIIIMWKPAGRFKSTELEGGCYMVKFDDEAYYQNALLKIDSWASLPLLS